jgi:hypothetical protein
MYELKLGRPCKLVMAPKLHHLIQRQSIAALQQALGEQKRSSEQILAES